MSKIVIIEYGAGNLFSVKVAIERLGYEVAVSYTHLREFNLRR